MNLILRGHIRNSFSNDSLNRLVFEISKKHKLDIYVHTWSVLQSSRSWRHIPDDERAVDESMVLDYFDGLGVSIRRVIIEDESEVELKGRLDGTVGHTPCPIKGYKYMFHGMLKAAECVLEDAGPEDLVVQTRFDVLSNWGRFGADRIVSFMDVKPSKRIQFIMEEVADESTVGVDNIYMAKALDMHNFLKHMLDDLDEIDLKHKSTRHMGHQEWLTMFEAVDFFAT
jgi:hypothetical protein